MNYPTDYENNIKFRAKCLYQASKDDKYKIALYKACSQDILFWVNVFCWTKDQRVRPTSILPFITYPFQDDAILKLQDAIDTQYDILIEKSRDMGVSWLTLYVYTHKWLFEEGSDFRCGSRKEDFVDKIGDIDTLLEKVRFTISRLPEWMRPRKNDMAWMRLLNHDNKNAIIGESANEDFGTGGRRKSVFIDEGSKWDNSKIDAAWTSTADVTNCRIIVSTPKGSSNKFAQLARGTEETIEKLTLHWTMHPKKNIDCYYYDGGKKIPVKAENAFKLWRKGYKIRSIWYDGECERRSASDIAQELDIDYLSSGSPYFDLIQLGKQQIYNEAKDYGVVTRVPQLSYVRGELIDIDGRIEFRQKENEGWLRLYEFPLGHMEYMIGSDTAEGSVGGDRSISICRDKYFRNMVASIVGHHKPEDFAYKTWLLKRFYNDSMVVAENNAMGYATCHELDRLGTRQYMTGKKRGFTTTAQSRALILAQMEEEIRKSSVLLRDPDLIAECNTFVVKENGRIEADGVFHDDCVMAWAICGQGIQEFPYKPKSKSSGKRRALVEERKRKVVV